MSWKRYCHLYKDNLRVNTININFTPTSFEAAAVSTASTHGSQILLVIYWLGSASSSSSVSNPRLWSSLLFIKWSWWLLETLTSTWQIRISRKPDSSVRSCRSLVWYSIWLNQYMSTGWGLDVIARDKCGPASCISNSVRSWSHYPNHETLFVSSGTPVIN